MKRNTLALLRCPTCHAELMVEATNSLVSIETGTLLCRTCNKSFPIHHGIPHFVQQSELSGFNKTFAHKYDWFSWFYTAFSKIGFRLLGTTDAHARQELLSRLEPGGGKLLEVSIGPGINLPYLVNSPSIGEIHGLDISIGQLNRCRSLIQRKGWLVDLYLGNAEELPFADDSFDSVFHIGGINFFNDKKKAILEMIRVAKPGSRIIICDENESGAQWYEKFLPGFKNAFHGQREAVSVPLDLVPTAMLDRTCENIWNGFMYCIQFRKPHSITREQNPHG